jgi:Cu/Ag efflux pump CusA
MINRLIDVALQNRFIVVVVYLVRASNLNVGGNAFRVASLVKETQEAVGGVVVARTGVNTKNVIDAVKARIAQIAPGLPQGVRGVMDWWQGHEDSSICC